MSGWVKVNRNLLEHWIWNDKPFSKGQAWIDIILLANHSDKKVLVGGEFVEIERGSFITSELKLMERWGWSKNKVRSFLQILQTDSMIVKKTDRKRTTINVVNYGKYQISETTKEPPMDHEWTTDGPPKVHKQECKNDKNINNIYIRARAGIPTVEEVQAYCLERKNKVNAQAFVDYYDSIDWMSGKNKITDWKAKVRIWERQTRQGETAKHGNKFNNFDGRSYDMGALEKQLLDTDTGGNSDGRN